MAQKKRTTTLPALFTPRQTRLFPRLGQRLINLSGRNRTLFHIHNLIPAAELQKTDRLTTILILSLIMGCDFRTIIVHLR